MLQVLWKLLALVSRGSPVTNQKHGKNMKIYLDNCSFNRPFDDQSSMRIKLETEAKLFVQEKILIGKIAINLVTYFRI